MISCLEYDHDRKNVDKETLVYHKAKKISAITAIALIALTGCGSEPTSEFANYASVSNNVDTELKSLLDSRISNYEENHDNLKRIMESPEVSAVSNVSRSDANSILNECDNKIGEIKKESSSYVGFAIKNKIDDVQRCSDLMKKNYATIDSELGTLEKARKNTEESTKDSNIEEEKKNQYRSELEKKFQENINTNELLTNERFRDAKRFSDQRGSSPTYYPPSPSPTRETKPSSSTPSPAESPTPSSEGTSEQPSTSSPSVSETPSETPTESSTPSTSNSPSSSSEESNG